MKRSWNSWRRCRKRAPELDARVKKPRSSGRDFKEVVQLFSPSRYEGHRAPGAATDWMTVIDSMIADYQCRYLPMISSILFRINNMEARRMTGHQQLRIGTDNGQPQGLEFQSQRQMQDLWCSERRILQRKFFGR